MGIFITLEGCDGSGKSTMVDLVYNHLIALKIDVIKTREPGGTNVAELFRELIMNENISARAEALTFAAARSENLREIILPSLQAGKIVLSDRFIDSSLAYQGYARGLGISTIYEINKFATNNIFPDLTIYLRINSNLGLNRIKLSKNRKMNRLDWEPIEFHQKVQEGFDKISKKYAKRIVVVDASQNINIVKREILKIINQKFKLW